MTMIIVDQIREYPVQNVQNLRLSFEFVRICAVRIAPYRNFEHQQVVTYKPLTV